MVSRSLYAAILIGGNSRRMGFPKHLLSSTDTKTWLEKTVRLLESFVDEVVIVGKGELPPSCASLCRLADVNGIDGPMAGVLSAMRFAPESDWLVVACDMPSVNKDSIRWLIDARNGSAWGRVPRLDNNKDFLEPLFAFYRAPALALFEELFRKQQPKISLIARFPEIETPLVPFSLRQSWQNINTFEELLRYQNGEQ